MSPELIVSPACVACAGEIPNWVGEVPSPTWTSAEIPSATIGIAAPASSTAPRRTGRHHAAAATTTTSSTITATFPKITAPGFAKALPAVRDWTWPLAVCSVKLSHEGANVIAAPSAAAVASTSLATRSRSVPFGLPSRSDRRNRNAVAAPAVHRSQPMSASTRPAPRRAPRP